MILSLFLLIMTLLLSKVTIHSLSHNYPIDMRLEWRLGEFYACLAWLDNFCCGMWYLCVETIVADSGSFTLIGFSDGSLVCTIFFRASK